MEIEYLRRTDMPSIVRLKTGLSGLEDLRLVSTVLLLLAPVLLALAEFCLLLISSMVTPPDDTSCIDEKPDPPPITSRLLATVRPFTDALSSMIFMLRELDMPEEEILLLEELSMYTSWLVLLDTDRNSEHHLQFPTWLICRVR